MREGFLHLLAFRDCVTLKVLSWQLSNTIDTEFCIKALRLVQMRCGAAEIFNTDQGSQFTTLRFTEVLETHQIRISMDERGPWLDNVFIERLWQSQKQECAYMHAFETESELRTGLTAWISHCNGKRSHSALAGRTPDEVYHEEPPPLGPRLIPDPVVSSNAVKQAA